MISWEHQFVYDDSVSVQLNFQDWYELNRDERQAFGENELSRDEAFLIFKKIYADKVDTVSS